MGLFITILKIIGIILLVIVALVLFVVGLVLFVPVGYKAGARKNDPADDFSAGALVTYLLHIVSVRFAYDDSVQYSVRIFGIKIRPRKEKKDAGTEVEPETEDDHIEESITLTEEEMALTEENTETEDVPPPEYNPQTQTLSVQEDDKPEKSLSDRIDEMIDKITSGYDHMEEKISRIRDRINAFEKAVNDPGNRNAFELIKKETLRLLKKIAPQKITGFVHFGFEDPATTGKVLMYLALIYPSLPRKLKVDPGWDDTDLYGSLDMKGHLALITVLASLVRLVCNRDCRRLWRSYRNRGHI